MNTSRLITLPTLILAFTALFHAQQVAQPTNDPETEIVSKDKVDSKSRANTANLFSKANSPLLDTINNSTETKPKPPVAAADEWQFQVTPYLWIPRISGRTGIGNLTTDVDAALSNDNVGLNFGFMATFEARKNRWMILTDLQFSNLGTDNSTPGPFFSSSEADFKTFILDPEVGYRVLENPETGAYVDVLGGVRYWHLKTDLTFNAGILPGVSASRSRQWADGVAGLRGRVFISPRWFLTGKGDLGGGGSNFTYQLFGGGGVLVGRHYALIGGYRYLNVNYNKDNFLFDMALHGPIVGVGIKF